MGNDFQERQQVYDRMFQFLLEMDVHELPTPLEKICGRMGVELRPMSRIIAETGWTEKEIHAVWNNRDGHLMPYVDRQGKPHFKIAYNDSDYQRDRKIFTIAEEVSHLVLGHYEHEMYGVFDRPGWDEAAYRQHEKCARIAAGILICPPPVFYAVNGYLSVEGIQELCNISRACAAVRYQVLLEYRREIMEHPLYKPLFYNYEQFLQTLPCPICKTNPVIPSAGMCYRCLKGDREACRAEAL